MKFTFCIRNSGQVWNERKETKYFRVDYVLPITFFEYNLAKMIFSGNIFLKISFLNKTLRPICKNEQENLDKKTDKMNETNKNRNYWFEKFAWKFRFSKRKIQKIFSSLKITYQVDREEYSKGIAFASFWPEESGYKMIMLSRKMVENIKLFTNKDYFSTLFPKKSPRNTRACGGTQYTSIKIDKNQYLSLHMEAQDNVCAQITDLTNFRR